MCQARGWLVNSIFFIFKFKFNNLIKFFKKINVDVVFEYILF